MRKHLVIAIVMLSPYPAFAIKGTLMGTVGYENLETKWKQGGDPLTLKGFSLGAQFSLPLFSLSSATSFSVAPAFRLLRVNYEETKEYDFGKQDVKYSTMPYFIGGDAGIRYTGGKITFDLFGMYYHCLGGEFENTLYTHVTDYTSTGIYDYKKYVQYGGGARFFIPVSDGIHGGIEGVYYMSELEIQNQESEADHSELTQTAWAVKLVIAKKVQ